MSNYCFRFDIQLTQSPIYGKGFVQQLQEHADSPKSSLATDSYRAYELEASTHSENEYI